MSSGSDDGFSASIEIKGLCAVAVVGATNRSLYGIDENGNITGKRLFLFNDTGQVAVGLGVNDDGDGMLRAYSSTGKELFFAGASVGGNGWLKVNSSTGKERIYLGSGASGNGFMIGGYNKTGEMVVQLKADAYGNGYVGAFDRKGMGRTLEPGP